MHELILAIENSGNPEAAGGLVILILIVAGLIAIFGQSPGK